MKPLRFQSAALLEAEAACLFYEERQPALGNGFKAALHEACQRLARQPSLHSSIGEGCHCCRLVRFPFGVIFREHDEFIEVVAVMHLQRQPGYWIERL